jgi:Zn finger protein HypA/HybF involved in hydrogenase expression
MFISQRKRVVIKVHDETYWCKCGRGLGLVHLETYADSGKLFQDLSNRTLTHQDRAPQCPSCPNETMKLKVSDYERSFVEPAVIRCHCGAAVILDRDDGYGIACDKCGQLYNLGGQRLVPRDQWEEPIEPDDYY